MEPVKICPKCGAEYYPDILECADCQVALQWAQESEPSLQDAGDPRREEDRWWGVEEDAPPAGKDNGWDGFVGEEILGQVTADREGIVRRYRQHLARLGIPSAVLPTTRFEAQRYRIEFSAAFGNREVLEKCGQVPVVDGLGGFRYDLFVRCADFARAEEIVAEMFAEQHPGQDAGLYREYEEGRCPACGAELAEEAVECPDCGLPFADEEDTED